mmetsp:Transcript_9609/g.29619  ORF Transcript_9609/g.29619 Transcript_9609/m.29619 type:complete len:243 (+) Transcript_9609:44-772(+)|eukprot:CAMPEP_0177658312 /NCGR_PEP_ID=MMETSP0447-20121125/16735_1 /TAXON_ID=0 /ORGANISM="Stygamoeba regulata, Strain BSH-02190019" /LENGTH=242 /DNA_ID=CAMNT_0019162893 /DNA_START=52 /DNA_END=780 /DNA_ORIENTATION=+
MSATVVHKWSDRTTVDSAQEHSGVWDPESSLREKLARNGYMVEGRLVEVRNHSVKDSRGRYARYQALVILIEACRSRTFAADGSEIDTHIRKTEKVKKGYLHHYDTRVLEDVFAVTPDQLQRAIGSPSCALPDGFYDAGKSKVHPAVEKQFEFWGDHLQFKPQELGIGDHVRITTKGDTLFVHTLYNSRAAATVPAKYAGEAVGNSWTNKIFKHKADEESPADDKQGVDADEWDDDAEAWEP